MSGEFAELLFDSDDMPIAKIRGLLNKLNVQKQRWIGTHHPDNRIRVEAFRSSGIEIGRDIFISIGMVVLDGYKQLVTIGDRVAFGDSVSLIADSSPNNSRLKDNEYVKKNCIKCKPISIGNDVWVGSKVVVLPGVNVGEQSVIGAGSLVNTNLPSYSIAIGSPAKVVMKIR